MTRKKILEIIKDLDQVWIDRYINVEEGLDKTRDLWDQAKEAGDPLAQAYASITYGQMSIYSGDIQTAFDNGNQGLRQLEDLFPDQATVYHMKAHNFIGTAHLMSGEFGEALQHYNRAFYYAEHSQPDPYRMCVYQNLGEFYRGILLDYDKALIMYDLAYDVSKDFPQVLTPITIAGKALTLATMQRRDQALALNNQAKAYLSPDLPPFIHSLLCQFLANTYVDLAAYQEALAMCQYGIRIMRGRQDDYTRLNLLIILGQAFCGLNKNHRAILACDHALNLSQSHFNDSILLTAYKVLGQAYEGLKEWEKSSHYKALSLEYTIKEMNVQVQRQSAVLTSELKYKTLEKDLEIKRLKNLALIEQKAQLEETTQKLKETLANLTKTQAHLVQSEKLAALGELVAGVSHEINTPLGVSISISSFIQDSLATIQDKLQAKTLSQKQLTDLVDRSIEALKVLSDSLNRAATIVNTFKQVAVDQYTYKSRWFNVNQYLKDIVTITKPLFKDKDLMVTITCPQDLEILSYPGALYQGLVQLMDNAAAHAFDGRSQGHIQVQVALDSDQVHLTFRDDGSGIPKDKRDKVFNPFYTSKKQSQHIGLGLHTLHNLVSQVFQGSIRLESQLNQGTCLHITFAVDAYRYN